MHFRHISAKIQSKIWNLYQFLSVRGNISIGEAGLWLCPWNKQYAFHPALAVILTTLSNTSNRPRIYSCKRLRKISHFPMQNSVEGPGFCSHAKCRIFFNICSVLL